MCCICFIWNCYFINDYVFYCCKSITSIEIPNSVTSIGASTFCGTAITSIEIPNSVTSIGAYAFNSCQSLVSARLPEGIAELDTGLFHHCYALESVNIPNSVTKIKHAAFLCCWSLKNITIPSGVTKIEYYAFVDCEALTSLTIPSSVTAIGHEAFAMCMVLRNITLTSGDFPYGWGSNALYRCGSLLDEYGHPTLTMHLMRNIPAEVPDGAPHANAYDWTVEHLANIGAPWGAQNLNVKFMDHTIVYKDGQLVG